MLFHKNKLVLLSRRVGKVACLKWASCYQLNRKLNIQTEISSFKLATDFSGIRAH